MSRMVNCRKYGKDMVALDFPPMPGEKGIEIYNSISKQAWQDWMAHQTTLINEKRLNVMSLSDKAYLDEQRELFFSGGDVELAEGFVPVDNTSIDE